MPTLTMAMGQFQILFLAAKYTHKMPVITPIVSKSDCSCSQVLSVSITVCGCVNLPDFYSYSLRAPHGVSLFYAKGFIKFG